MTFDFRSRTPAPPLDRLVSSLWYAHGQVAYRRERIAPTGSTVAVFVLGAPIIQTPDDGRGAPFTAERGFLVGPHDRPAVNEPTGETHAVGIVTTPIGCAACFGVRPSRIRGLAVDLEETWPAASDLRMALLQCTGPDRMLDLLEATLNQTANAGDAGPSWCERAVALLEDDPTRPIADIAAELGKSHGHLDRTLARTIGLSPRRFARLMRMRRLLKLIDVNATIDWADMAARFGWFDQPHFIRDFKRHTGVAPSYYVRAQRETFDKDEIADAAGFVPES